MPEWVTVALVGLPVWFVLAVVIGLVLGPRLRRRRIADVEVRAAGLVGALDGMGEDFERVWPAGRTGGRPE